MSTFVAPADAWAQQRTAGPARNASDALGHARQLFAAHRADEALAAIDEGLKAAPNDAQLRFERGMILAEVGRTDDAVEVFTALTREFPELPEPHNNLAALHAARGELDQARSALEDALRALPSYALAHENLGDVQLRLAEREYQRATGADATNRAAHEKLALTRDLLAKIAPAATPGVGARSTAPAAAVVPAESAAPAVPAVPAPSATPDSPDAR